MTSQRRSAAQLLRRIGFGFGMAVLVPIVIGALYLASSLVPPVPSPARDTGDDSGPPTDRDSVVAGRDLRL